MIIGEYFFDFDKMTATINDPSLRRNSPFKIKWQPGDKNVYLVSRTKELFLRPFFEVYMGAHYTQLQHQLNMAYVSYIAERNLLVD